MSNIAFSFRGNEPVRRAFHSAFLHHGCAVGMDMGIVNAAQVRLPLCGLPAPRRSTPSCSPLPRMYPNKPPVFQVTEDVYENIDPELLTFVEDVLLNRREDATERLLEFAATLDPKSKPCAVKRLNEDANANIPPRVRSAVQHSVLCFEARARG